MPNPTLAALLATATEVATEQHRAAARTAARLAWVRETVAAAIEANKRVADAWGRIFDEFGDALPEDLDEEALEALPEPPEQAELDALNAALFAVRDHDRWPRELHWSL